MISLENIVKEFINEFGDELEEQVVKILVKEALEFISRKMKKRKVDSQENHHRLISCKTSQIFFF